MLKAAALLLAALLHSAQGENVTYPYGCGLDGTNDNGYIFITKNPTNDNPTPHCTNTDDVSGFCTITKPSGGPSYQCGCQPLIALVCNISQLFPNSLVYKEKNVICGCDTELCQEAVGNDRYQPACNKSKIPRTVHYNCSSTAPWPCPADFTLEAAPPAPAPAAHGYDRAGAAPAIAISVVLAALVFMSVASK
jgi:hypothetical protein